MTRTEKNLNEHKLKKHSSDGVEEIVNIPEKLVYLHSCISCDFKSNDYDNLREHIMQHKGSAKDLTLSYAG